MARQLALAPFTTATKNTKHLLGRCLAYSFADLLPIHADSACEVTWNLPTLVDSSRGGSRRTSRLSEQISLLKVGATMVKVLKCYIETEEVYPVAEAASNLLKDLFRAESPFR